MPDCESLAVALAVPDPLGVDVDDRVPLSLALTDCDGDGELLAVDDELGVNDWLEDGLWLRVPDDERVEVNVGLWLCD